MPFRLCWTFLLCFFILNNNYGKAAETQKGNEEEEEEEQYKQRRWSSTSGNGPYRMVVSSLDNTELQPEESVAFLVSLQEKKISKNNKPQSDDNDNDDVTKFDKIYDKVTQRALLKRHRKRDRYLLETADTRKRRRNSIVHQSTTGLPQTMSYNLYNHFRPLEQDVPQDAILPFLDFGRKLSKNIIGSTTSALNSIESSSTPRNDLISSTEIIEDEENLFHEDMDVTVTKKAIERNVPPKITVLQNRQPLFTAYLKKNISEVTKQIETTTLSSLLNIENKNKSENHSIMNKTNVHFDLQSNESGIKVQTVLSPNYGLKLNKTDTLNITDIQQNNTNIKQPIASRLTAENVTQIEKQSTNSTSPPKPSPTAKILSTAVVTSVSIRESLRYPRIRLNYSTNLENYHRNNTNILKTEITNTSNTNEPIPLHNNNNNKTFRFDSNYFNASRRKQYTTLRPKTTTYKPVTFRSTFRRNGSYVPAAVVHIVSTPPSYIEVPKILTRKPFYNLNRTTYSSITERITTQITINNNSTSTTITTIPSQQHETEELTTPQVLSKLRITQPLETTTPITIENHSTTTIQPITTTTTTTQQTSITDTERTTQEIITEPSIVQHITQLNNNKELKQIDESTAIEFDDKIETSNESQFDDIDEILTTTPIIAIYDEIENITKKPDLSWIYNNNHHQQTQRNTSTVIKTQSASGVGVYQDASLSLVTYILAGLGVIPLLLGVFILVRQVLLKSKKKVLDESEYSSEYNRSPLPTKLPRLPAHVISNPVNWEENKPTKWEFSRDKLRLQTVLGQGNFGQVWKAEADDICDHEGLTRLVAVKTVKEGTSLREKEDLLRELGIMQELGAHPNVVQLLGCCTEKEPYFLIMEYVMYGKLLAFLRDHRTKAHYFNFSDLSSALTSRDLTVFSYCVARGMEYLVSKGIIHRDLAARNILVDHNKLCKIADFGMSRNVRDTGQIYEQRPNRGALPIRWMAPESLHFSLFTHRSDVWSFGILLWEIITLGSTPYSTMGAREVMRQVREGYRLDKPKHCKIEFYKILTKCWHNDPMKRPTFNELKQDIGSLLGDKETDGCYVDLDALAEEMCDQVH